MKSLVSLTVLLLGVLMLGASVVSWQRWGLPESGSIIFGIVGLFVGLRGLELMGE